MGTPITPIAKVAARLAVDHPGTLLGRAAVYLLVRDYARAPHAWSWVLEWEPRAVWCGLQFTRRYHPDAALDYAGFVRDEAWLGLLHCVQLHLTRIVNLRKENFHV